ncbi:DUF6538 domain-containing protein [Methylorubrum extorquens]
MAGAVRYLIQRGDAFYARIVVPVDLRPLVGKTELRAPLGSNRKFAERALHVAVAEMHDQLAAARGKLNVEALPKPRTRTRPLTVAQIARTHFAEELALDDADRNLLDSAGRVDMTWARDGYTDLLRRVASGRASTEEAQAAVGWAIAKFHARGSTMAEPNIAEWRVLARTLAQVQLEAIDAVNERDAGREPSPPTLPILAEPPTPAPVVPFRSRGAALPILDLLDAYLKTLKAQGKGAEAERRWRPAFKSLVRYLGHDDARHVAKADLDGWRDHLQEEEKLAPKTIRDVHLASVRVVLGWAADNDKLSSNPAARVRIDVAKPVRTRERGLNDVEAAAVLRAALYYQPRAAYSSATRESAHVTAAKRWLPWLCALTGARVAEMAQLRVQDVMQKEGINFMRVTPDAGSVKSGQYRDVPVHPQLLDLGFLNFVKKAGQGPLFYNFDKARSGAQGPFKIVAARVSSWVRSLGVIDAAVDPSHGWRHRFKTVGREAEISDRVLDAIQGHAGRTAGDDYGDVTLKTRHAAILKIPHYSFEPSVDA